MKKWETRRKTKVKRVRLAPSRSNGDDLHAWSVDEERQTSLRILGKRRWNVRFSSTEPRWKRTREKRELFDGVDFCRFCYSLGRNRTRSDSTGGVLLFIKWRMAVTKGPPAVGQLATMRCLASRYPIASFFSFKTRFIFFYSSLIGGWNKYNSGSKFI